RTRAPPPPSWPPRQARGTTANGSSRRRTRLSLRVPVVGPPGAAGNQTARLEPRLGTTAAPRARQGPASVSIRAHWGSAFGPGRPSQPPANSRWRHAWLADSVGRQPCPGACGFPPPKGVSVKTPNRSSTGGSMALLSHRFAHQVGSLPDTHHRLVTVAIRVCTLNALGR